MRCFASEGGLISEPLSILLDATNFFAIVVWNGVLHRLTRRVDTIALDVLVKVVIFLRNLVGVFTMEQGPDRGAYGRTGEPTESRAGESETSVDVDGVETCDGVAGIDFEREKVGSGGGTCEQGGGDGGHHAG